MSWAGRFHKALAKGVKKAVEKGIEGMRDKEPDMQHEHRDMQHEHSSRKTECKVSRSDACPLASLRESTKSLVFPGGKTSCLQPGSEYAFQVYPGDTDKLYLHFQGGGACWNALTTTVSQGCKDDLGWDYTGGIWNRSDDRNPIQNHTIVVVVYCTGDVHAGDKKQIYGGVQQRGYVNSKAVLDWVAVNFAHGLKSLLIGGCSAGALGAQAWVSAVLDRLHYQHAAVVFDSYLPLFPEGTDGELLNNLGICHTPLIVDAGLKDKCKAKQLTFGRLLQIAVEKHPHVTFAVLNSKGDGSQQYFGDMLGTTMGLEVDIVDGASYYVRANEFIETLNKYPNFVSFMVGGDMAGRHCFSFFPDVYTVTVNGTFLSANRSGAEPAPQEHRTIAEFIGDVVNVRHRVDSDCLGKRLRKEAWSGLSYCDDAIVPKEIQDRAGWAHANAVGQKFAEGRPVAALAAVAAQAPEHVGSVTAVVGLLVLAATSLAVLRRRRRGVADVRGWTPTPSVEDVEALSPVLAVE